MAIGDYWGLLGLLGPVGSNFDLNRFSWMVLHWSVGDDQRMAGNEQVT